MTSVRLIELLLLKLKEQEFKEKEVKFSIDEYMQLYAKTDLVYTRNKIKKELEILKRTRITFRKDDGEYTSINILKKKSCIVKNVISMYLNDVLYNIFKKSSENLYIPKSYLQFNEKYNPNFYLIARKIISSIKDKDETILAVEDIYEDCSTIPRIETVKKSNRAYSTRIRKPIDDAFKLMENEFEISYVEEISEDAEFNDWLKSSVIVKSKINRDFIEKNEVKA